LLLEEPWLRFHLPNNETSMLRPFFWDGEKNGAFNIFSLLMQQKWITQTDAELAFECWQKTARLGYLNRDDYPEDYDDLLADDAVHDSNDEVYSQLKSLIIESAFPNQSWSLSCSPIYKNAIAIVELGAGKWLGLAATSPPETLVAEELIRLPIPMTEGVDSKRFTLLRSVEKAIAQLTALPIYGFYGGGYDCHFDYRLVSTTGNSLADVFEKTLIEAGLLEMSLFKEFNPETFRDYFCDEKEEFEKIERRYSQLNAFLLENLDEPKYICLSFWNTTYLFVLGKTQDDDLVGVVVESTFDYNP